MTFYMCIVCAFYHIAIIRIAYYVAMKKKKESNMKDIECYPIFIMTCVKPILISKRSADTKRIDQNYAFKFDWRAVFI